MVVEIALAAAGLALGGGVGYAVRHSMAKNKTNSAEARALDTITKAKKESEEIILKGKQEALQFQEEAKKEEKARQQQLERSQQRIEQREEKLDQKLNDLDTQREDLLSKAERLKELKVKINELEEQQLKKLEEVANLSKEDAKGQLLQRAEKQYAEELTKELERLESEKQDALQARAQDILTLAIQRTATSHASEITTTNLPLPSDELKGRIIGKEGRNIKRLETLTGCELIIDDTPEMIVISGFDPIRRQIAKSALESLIADGRIHPSRIEEAVAAAKKNIVQKIQEAGKAAIQETRIVGFHPKIVQILGRLRYRTSYGQNVLLHSIEVSHLAGALAAELGLDVNVAKKAGLVHDIGKAVDHEIEGGHVEIGMNILKKFNVSKEVIDAMKSHHEDYPYESNEAHIVQAADAISASRPGARRDSIERYLNRLRELEEVASSFEGIEKSYAIQAGREVRVFVKPEEVDDLGAMKLTKDVAGKIEEQLQYPGEIKVCVIREQRFTEKAR